MGKIFSLNFLLNFNLANGSVPYSFHKSFFMIFKNKICLRIQSWTNPKSIFNVLIYVLDFNWKLKYHSNNVTFKKYKNIVKHASS